MTHPTPTRQDARYRVQSLERGLSILRELRASNAPVRNLDLVTRTQLPKATVSRLLNTLGALGYVRRIDQGRYVLDHASSRSGRTLIGSMDLKKFQELFVSAPGPVYLEAVTGGMWLPVYRWFGPCTGPLANGCPVDIGPPGQRGCDAGTHWSDAAGIWWAWIGFHMPALGCFVLTVRVSQRVAPTGEQLDRAAEMLRHAITVLTLDEQP